MKSALFFILSSLLSRYKGTLVHELDVPLPAGEVWGVYGTLLVTNISIGLIPGAKLEVDGDGRVGTILLVTFPSDPTGFPSGYLKQKYVKVDDEERVKEVLLLEGGFLDYGFTLCLFRFEIVEKGDNSCTIKSSLEYAIDEEHADNIAYANVRHHLASMAKTISKYLLERKSRI